MAALLVRHGGGSPLVRGRTRIHPTPAGTGHQDAHADRRTHHQHHQNSAHGTLLYRALAIEANKDTVGIICWDRLSLLGRRKKGVKDHAPACYSALSISRREHSMYICQVTNLCPCLGGACG